MIITLIIIIKTKAISKGSTQAKKGKHSKKTKQPRGSMIL